jgi:hypothetical protein
VRGYGIGEENVTGGLDKGFGGTYVGVPRGALAPGAGVETGTSVEMRKPGLTRAAVRSYKRRPFGGEVGTAKGPTGIDRLRAGVLFEIVS